MATTYTPITTTTLASASNTITFSSIPATYTDLRLVIYAIGSQASWSFYTRYNNDSATNYSFTYINGNGTAASSGGNITQSAQNPINGSSLTTTPALITEDIFSYANTANKTTLATVSNDKNGSGDTTSNVFLWRGTSAINRIDIIANGANTFASGTVVTLYGIKAA